MLGSLPGSCEVNFRWLVTVTGTGALEETGEGLASLPNILYKPEIIIVGTHKGGLGGADTPGEGATRWEATVC